MSSKNISITEKAYNHLKQLKRKEESFSDVILKLTNIDLTEFIGTWKEDKEFEAFMKKTREKSNKSAKERFQHDWA